MYAIAGDGIAGRTGEADAIGRLVVYAVGGEGVGIGAGVKDDAVAFIAAGVRRVGAADLVLVPIYDVGRYVVGGGAFEVDACIGVVARSIPGDFVGVGIVKPDAVGVVVDLVVGYVVVTASIPEGDCVIGMVVNRIAADIVVSRPAAEEKAIISVVMDIVVGYGVADGVFIIDSVVGVVELVAGDCVAWGIGDMYVIIHTIIDHVVDEGVEA